MKDRGVTFHDYNGGGLDGPNCRKVLNMLAELATFFPVKLLDCIATSVADPVHFFPDRGSGFKNTDPDPT